MRITPLEEPEVGQGWFLTNIEREVPCILVGIHHTIPRSRELDLNPYFVALDMEEGETFFVSSQRWSRRELWYLTGGRIL